MERSPSMRQLIGYGVAAGVREVLCSGKYRNGVGPVIVQCRGWRDCSLRVGKGRVELSEWCCLKGGVELLDHH